MPPAGRWTGGRAVVRHVRSTLGAAFIDARVNRLQMELGDVNDLYSLEKLRADLLLYARDAA